MDITEIRNTCLHLAVSAVSGLTSDPRLILDAARQFEAYVTGKDTE